MSHLVVTNDAGRYAVWPESRTLPAGWHPTGVSGTRDECLDSIAAVWTDAPSTRRAGPEGERR